MADDYDRLIRWMQSNYPPADYNRNQIRYWLKQNVPAYEHMKKSTHKELVKDWENFTIYQRDKEGKVKYIGTSEHAVKSWLGRISNRLRNMIRNILKRG